MFSLSLKLIKPSEYIYSRLIRIVWDRHIYLPPSDGRMYYYCELQYHCDTVRYNHNIFRRNCCHNITRVIGYVDGRILGYVVSEVICEIYRLANMTAGLFISDEYDAYGHWKFLPEANRKNHLPSLLKFFALLCVNYFMIMPSIFISLVWALRFCFFSANAYDSSPVSIKTEN